jgi:hypothetical protein
MADNSTKLAIDNLRNQDFVEEKIDERILRLLGIEDVFDIDYETYLTLLKEMMVVGRMNSKKIPTEEVELLTNEWKRIKGKAGRFKIKRGKINAKNIGGSVKSLKSSTKKLFLGGTIKDISQETTTTENKNFYDNIAKIRSIFESIYFSIFKQNKLAQKESDEKRKGEEDKKRRFRESALEKSVQKIKEVASKLLAPVRGILDKIFNFLWYTLLGKAFTKLIDWANNPENEQKIKSISRFLKDHWPALLSAYILFGTSFGKFVRVITATLIKGIARFAVANPAAAAIVGIGALGAASSLAAGYGSVEKMEKKRDLAKTQNKEDRSIWGSIGNAFNATALGLSGASPFGFKGGGLVSPTTDIKDISYAGGGDITSDSGLRITGAGQDTQLIAAQPGEVVISKQAVNRYGADFFLGLNKSAGGTNIPKMVNNIQLAKGGGMVGGSSGGLARETRSQMRFTGMNKNGFGSMMGGNKFRFGNLKPQIMSSGSYSTPNAKGSQRYTGAQGSFGSGQTSGGGIRTIVPTNTSRIDLIEPFHGQMMRGLSRTSGNSMRTSGQLGRMSGKLLEVGNLPSIGNIVSSTSTGSARQLGTLEGAKKSGLLNLKKPIIPPGPPLRRKSKSGFITLPPISSAPQGNMSKGKTGTITIPNFSAAQNSAHRQLNLATYGIG